MTISFLPYFFLPFLLFFFFITLYLFTRSIRFFSAPSSRFIYSSIIHYSSRQLTMSSTIIEQTNPLASGQQASYQIKHGHISFNEFILSYPRGAYTGMRTVGRGSILELNSHMKRIVNSLTLMKFNPTGKDGEPDTVSDQLVSFRHIDSLEEKLIPMLRAGLEAYYNHIPEAEQAKVSLMVTYSFELQRPCFAAHIGHLGQPPKQRIKVELENKARTMPSVKDSQWVRDRASLEKSKRQGINEVVLIDDQGNVYEGMASNFFAVRRRNNSYVIQCASLEHILLGTVMKVLMSLCEQAKINIEWVFPKIQDARSGKWEGCFLTSTTRLLLPIETIYPKDGSAPIDFPESEFIQQLQQMVNNEMKNKAYPILD
ncbi:aminotransferase [Halteromyces radiatus]|uniref:aminotransferase n=1 Tax=Halteromyces radiatus TaxID=101107 RepID=UPI00221F510C|nr:aminotransferase [Halteromyces radiatus]KAI8077757.1 aminotransferase [Halteromyces radiatus]